MAKLGDFENGKDMIFTKIVCTIGPAVDSVKKIIELIDMGMNVARINFSHGDYDQHEKTLDNLKKAQKITKKPLSIMLDTKGPEVRVSVSLKDCVKIKKGEKVFIKEKVEDEKTFSITPIEILDCLKKDVKILFNDGYVITRVCDIKKEGIVLEGLNDGVIKPGNSVNIPGIPLNLPAMTEKDKKDLAFGCLHDIDIVAASFIRSSEHLLSIKKFLREKNREDILVVAKIENKMGVENFDSIVEVADGIMVARGDLGVEVDISLVPRYQKMMIQKSNYHYKPVITSTQMLESMIKNPMPTRAEASDVANAIYDSTSCVMLSGETAVGKYPKESVRVMKNIIKVAEEDFDHLGFFEKEAKVENMDISSALAISAVKTAYNSKAKAFFVYTSSGFTARLISRWRPNKPVVALTTDRRVYHQLGFVWGVIPVYTEKCEDARKAFDIMSDFSIKNNIVSFGDLVIVTAGMPFGKKGSTNLMVIDSIGHVLVRGYDGIGENVEGKVSIMLSSDKKDVRGDILVIPRCDESYFPLIKKVKGVVLQNALADKRSKENAIKICRKHGISLIVGAENATTLLQEGKRVVMDTKKWIIYPK